MRNSPAATRRADDLSSGTPRSSTVTPRDSARSLTSPSSSRSLTTPTHSSKVSPTLPRNDKGLHKGKSPDIYAALSNQGFYHLHASHLPHSPHAPPAANAAHTPPIRDDPESMSTAELVSAYKAAQRKLAELQHKLVDFQHKQALQESKGRQDQKKIQALELVLQREAASSSPFLPTSGDSTVGGRMTESKYLAQIDALSSKLYKLEERNQAMAEEVASLKSDLRNKKKEHESKIKELQVKHDFEMRALEQQQREFANGLRRETRKDVDGLKQHLVVQETDLQKKHLREVQDLKIEQLDRELQLKEVIHRLQDELDHLKQTGKRASIRRTESSMASDTDGDDDTHIDDIEEEGDPEECY